MSEPMTTTDAERLAELVAAFLARLAARNIERPVATALAGEYLRHLLARPVPSAETIRRSEA